jgi:hypothetical protein
MKLELSSNVGEEPVPWNREGAAVIDDPLNRCITFGAQGFTQNLNHKRNRHAHYDIQY